jgi:hypothetical protein
MAYNITTTFRSPLAIGGRDQSGVAVNGKVMVAGRINVTSYTTGGEVVRPCDIGLVTIDEIFFNAESFNNNATVPAAATIGVVGYIRSSSKMLVNTTGTTQNSSTEDAVIRFLAIGDDASAPDLT